MYFIGMFVFLRAYFKILCLIILEILLRGIKVFTEEDSRFFCPGLHRWLVQRNYSAITKSGFFFRMSKITPSNRESSKWQVTEVERNQRSSLW